MTEPSKRREFEPYAVETRSLQDVVRDWRCAFMKLSGDQSFEYARAACLQSRDAWLSFLGDFRRCQGADTELRTLGECLLGEFYRAARLTQQVDMSALAEEDSAQIYFFKENISERARLLETLLRKGFVALNAALRAAVG